MSIGDFFQKHKIIVIVPHALTVVYLLIIIWFVLVKIMKWNLICKVFHSYCYFKISIDTCMFNIKAISCYEFPAKKNYIVK